MEIFGLGIINDKKKIDKRNKNSLSFSQFIEEKVDDIESNMQAPTSVSLNNINMNLDIDNKELLNRKKAKKDAQTMVLLMENIRNSILEGEFSVNDINQLQKIVKQVRGNFIDTKLENILNEVELRAEVELAKIEKIQLNS